MNIVRTLRFTIKKRDYTIDYLVDNVYATLLNFKNVFQGDVIWFEQDRSKKKALQMEVLIDKDYIKQIIVKNWDKKFATLGSTFAFWSGKQNDMDNYQVGFTIGLTSKNENLNNNIYIRFPCSNASITAESIVVKQLKECILKIWTVIDSEII